MTNRKIQRKILKKLIKKILLQINNIILRKDLFMKVDIMSSLAKNILFMIEHQDNYPLQKTIITLISSTIKMI